MADEQRAEYLALIPSLEAILDPKCRGIVVTLMLYRQFYPSCSICSVLPLPLACDVCDGLSFVLLPRLHAGTKF
jgi:hypothetical protein